MKNTLFTIALAIAAAGAVPALAQPAEDPVATCRTAHAADPSARIACLESAIARIQGRVAVAEQQAVQAQQQAAAAPQQEARPGWSIPGFRAAQRSDEREEVRVQLTRIRYGRDGYGIFTTADGQVWRETVTAPARRRLEADQTYDAVIHRGVLGFRMNVDGIRWEYKVEPLN